MRRFIVPLLLLASFLLMTSPASAQSLMTGQDLLALPQPPADHTIAYGPAPQQVAELRHAVERDRILERGAEEPLPAIAERVVDLAGDHRMEGVVALRALVDRIDGRIADVDQAVAGDQVALQIVEIADLQPGRQRQFRVNEQTV